MRTPRKWHHHRHAPRGLGLALMCIAVLPMSTACSLVRLGNRSRWLADYETAERSSYESGKQLLIWYKEARPGFPDPLRSTFRDSALRERLRSFVTCSLVRSYEPDRRYVAQYGVERAPAVIVIHPDGTYHARTGRQSADQMIALLDDAVAPGAMPKLNAQIPRRPRYNWQNDVEAAQAEAMRTERSLLVVFYRWLSRDRRRLDKLLSRPEVFGRFAGMIHCRLGMHHKANRELAERLEVSDVPAMVILDPDGSFRRLELPTSYLAVVRFADAQGAPMPPDALEASNPATGHVDTTRVPQTPVSAARR